MLIVIMSILDLFDSRDKKKRLSHIRNLILLSLADGHVDESETQLITKIGLRAGLTLDELNRIFTRPKSIKFQAPESDRERIEQLYDMVMVMMVDGECHDNEIALCESIAQVLGFRREVIPYIVSKVSDSIMAGIVADVAVERLLASLEK